MRALHESLTDGVTLTITRDPLNPGDLTTIHATVFTHGNAEAQRPHIEGAGFSQQQSPAASPSSFSWPPSTTVTSSPSGARPRSIKWATI